MNHYIIELLGASYVSLHWSGGRLVGLSDGHSVQKNVKNNENSGFWNTYDHTSVQQGSIIMLECKIVCKQQKEALLFLEAAINYGM